MKQWNIYIQSPSNFSIEDNNDNNYGKTFSLKMMKDESPI